MNEIVSEPPYWLSRTKNIFQTQSQKLFPTSHQSSVDASLQVSFLVVLSFCKGKDARHNVSESK